MGSYTYEIIGGILIVFSSLVGEQMKPKWKVGFYAVFAAVAIAYSGIGIYLRREANITETTDREERRDEIKGLRRDMSNILAAFSQLGPTITSLNSDVGVMRKSLETSGASPQAIAQLGAKAEAAQQRVDVASKGLFVALGASLVRRLRSWRGSWSSPEGKEMVSSFDFICRGLLQGLQPTSEDTAIASFVAHVNGGDTQWDQERAARYLESLMGRTKIPAPPMDFSVTPQ